MSTATISRRFQISFGPVLASLLLAVASHAQGGSTPVVAHPIDNVTVTTGTNKTKLDLAQTFTVTGGGTSPVVKFSTAVGDIEVELTPDVAPATVANFLGYVNRGNYNGSFFHRAVSGFIIQGGGFVFQNGNTNTIPTQAAVVNEFNVSNTRGTIAMAKLGNDPNSATDQWFFNLADNGANLDHQNGGFTVFGHVTDNAGLAVIDAIAALRVFNFGSPFDTLPVMASYVNGAAVTTNDLVLLKQIQVEDTSNMVNLSVTKVSDPTLLTARFKGTTLVLKYTAGRTGKAKITVQAQSPSGATVTTKFKVTVQ